MHVLRKGNIFDNNGLDSVLVHGETRACTHVSFMLVVYTEERIRQC